MNLHSTIDYSKITGKINPELHSAGFSPRINVRDLMKDDDAIKDMHLSHTRTHDWALVNTGQRVVDTHFVFPLMKLDPSDPSNYYFKATDAALSLAKNIGLDIFYRMGTSIEHSGDQHFNILIPEDYEKYAEVLASIVRHYNKGWGDGYEWNIKYWAIWNEPDGITNCWGGIKSSEITEEKIAELRSAFIRFFIVVLKRLKSEFPEIKVGGPGLCWADITYFTELLTACKEAGVAPDFISWHVYNCDPSILIETPKTLRKLLDDLGFSKTELIMSEWHYLLSWDGLHGRPRTNSPDMTKRAMLGPTGHNEIDSASFNVAVMAAWQNGTPLKQAYHYGCGYAGSWGYVDGYRQFTKSYYSMKMIGDIVSNCEDVVESVNHSDKIYTLSAWSKDKKSAYFLITDYRGFDPMLRVELKGIKTPTYIEATVLDNSRECMPIDVKFRNGIISLPKDGPHSSVFLVKMEF